MTQIKELKDQLSVLLARLPELEWSASRLNAQDLQKQIAKGLFSIARDTMSVTRCIQEIEKDIHTLATQTSERSAVFLAEKIKQKINVLVILCQLDERKKKQQVSSSFSVTMLSTRQQWLQQLEQDILHLQQQHQALTNTLTKQKANSDPAMMLRLNAELGEVTQRLTLAQEAFEKAVKT